MIEQKIHEILSARRPSGLDLSGSKLWEMCVDDAGKLAVLAQKYDENHGLRPSVESSAEILFESIYLLEARSRAIGVKSSVWDSFANGLSDAFKAASPFLKHGSQVILNAFLASLTEKSIEKIREW